MTSPLPAEPAGVSARRDALVSAFLFLVQRCGRLPTAAETADVAGCAVASLHDVFVDFRDLGTCAFHQLLASVLAPGRAEPMADRATRIRLHVMLRATAWESLMDFWPVLQAQAARQPCLADHFEAWRQRRRLDLESLYAPELDRLSGPARRATLVIADSLTDPSAWLHLRLHAHLSFAEAHGRWIAALERLLPTPRPAQPCLGAAALRRSRSRNSISQ